jgi:glutamyl-tRNA synthetase
LGNTFPSYVGRFAPSPTGRIHLGVARTLLAAWLDARAHEGRILLRIEDIDTQRTVPGAADQIQRDLEWLGLDWDDGPTFQSTRVERYEAAIERLTDLGRTYPCTCSRKEIALVSSAPHGPMDEGPRYPGTCRSGAAERPDRAPSIRLRTELGDQIAHADRRFGAIDQSVHDVVGDFILRRADGMWAYQLAVSVDDLEQGVTDVVRGSDLLSSTPRQILVRRLLDASAPAMRTLHVPLILGPTGQRLAKRDGAIAVADRRARGQTPQALIAELAHGLGQVPDTSPITARELVALWDPAMIPAEDRKLADFEPPADRM